MRITDLREGNSIDRDESEEYSNGLIPPTPRNIKRYEAFLRDKWAERSKERYDSWGDMNTEPWSPPESLEGACKFASLFALRLFGGRMRGNEHHQYLELPNGKIIDPVPVPELKNPNYHDDDFWMNPEHKKSLESCLPRVNSWVKEFMAVKESIITELTKGVKKGSQKRKKIGFATDDPKKYIGKWEEYTEPQGINSKAGKKMTKTESAISEGVVDGIRFYHGQPRPSDGPIDKFRLNNEHDGIYFSTDPEYAASYATEFRSPVATDEFDPFDKTGVIYPVYLDIKNPLILDGENEEQREDYINRGFDRIEMKKRGYDGIILKYDDGEIEAQVFDPEQIKSALGEAFTYSPEFREIAPSDANKIVRSAGGDIEFAVVYPVDDTQYIAYAEKDTEYPDTYEFSFNEIDRSGQTPDFFDVTGKNTPLRVYSGAMKALEMFIGRFKPKAVRIIAAISGQIGLYRKIADRFKRNDYSVSNDYDGLMLVRNVSEGTLGPQQTRGLSNSSTGLGSAPPEIIISQTPWQRKANGKRKVPGSKAPTTIVKKNVTKSTKNKVRKLDSPVTEVFGDPSNSFKYWPDGNWYNIDLDRDDLSIVVGFEDIRNYNSSLPEGANVGMVSQDENGIHMGIEPAKIGLSTGDTIKLFNTLMNIVKDYVAENNPDRLYFVAVKPMEGIYKRLIRRFVDTNDWKVTVIKDVPIPMIGDTLNAYMLERKDKLTEMFRRPSYKDFNADYEVDENGNIVAKGSVTGGIIEEFMVRSDIQNNDFRGKYMSALMSAIVRDADMLNANMSMQVEDREDLEMKRFLERFGFRHVGDGIYKRTAGAITPPSVIY